MQGDLDWELSLQKRCLRRWELFYHKGQPAGSLCCQASCRRGRGDQQARQLDAGRAPGLSLSQRVRAGEQH